MQSYRLSQKQNNYILNANSRYNFKVGAVRSGKSFVDVVHVIPERLMTVKYEPGLNLILGVSKETIERNVLQPMREVYTDEIVGTINNRNIATVCGVPVYCLGAEKVTQVAKVVGMSVKYCYGDEIAKWHKDVFAMLQSRLDKPYSCMDGACNPEYPTHWLKKFIDREDIDLYVQEYQIFDNPFLPPEFVENLCKEYKGTVYYDRYILGKWTRAEGLIYPMYEEALESPPDARPTDYRLSIDYGTLNAFAALLWAKYGDVWYAVAGYYYSGRDEGQTKTDEDYAKDLDAFVADTVRSYGRKLKAIIDPSAASFITLLKRREWCTVIHADNAVNDGIRETATAIKTGRIKVDPSIKEWSTEAAGYVWDEKSEDEKPLKINDHCLVGETLVNTKNGVKPISELVGTSGKVWSYNTETGVAELKPYHDCRLTQEQAEIYEIETQDGRFIRCTGEHPILTKRGYVAAKELKLSDCITNVMDATRYNVEKGGRLHDTVY